MAGGSWLKGAVVREVDRQQQGETRYNISSGRETDRLDHANHCCLPPFTFIGTRVREHPPQGDVHTCILYTLMVLDTSWAEDFLVARKEFAGCSNVCPSVIFFYF